MCILENIHPSNGKTPGGFRSAPLYYRLVLLVLRFQMNHALHCLLHVASHLACFGDSPVLLWGISSSFLLLAEEFPIVWIYQNVSQCIFQVTCLCYVFIVVPRFDFSKKVTMDVHVHVFSFLLNQSVPRNGIAGKCKFSFSRNCQTVSYFEILIIWPQTINHNFIYQLLIWWKAKLRLKSFHSCLLFKWNPYKLQNRIP